MKISIIRLVAMVIIIIVIIGSAGMFASVGLNMMNAHSTVHVILGLLIASFAIALGLYSLYIIIKDLLKDIFKDTDGKNGSMAVS